LLIVAELLIALLTPALLVAAELLIVLLTAALFIVTKLLIALLTTAANYPQSLSLFILKKLRILE